MKEGSEYQYGEKIKLVALGILVISLLDECTVTSLNLLISVLLIADIMK